MYGKAHARVACSAIARAALWRTWRHDFTWSECMRQGWKDAARQYQKDAAIAARREVRRTLPGYCGICAERACMCALLGF